MIKILTFAVLLTITCSISVAQNRKAIDSLRRELSTAMQDTSRVISMQNLAGYYWTYKTDSALFFAQSALELARQIKFAKGESLALSALGLINASLGNATKSLELHLKALKVAEQNNLNGFEKASAYLHSGAGYADAGDYSKALSYMERSKRIFDSLHNNFMSQISWMWISFTYLSMNQPDSAMKYAQLAYDEMIRDNGHYSVEATTNILNALASAHAKKGNTQLALNYFRQSLAYSGESHGIRAMIYQDIAKLYQQTNKPDSAIVYAKRSLEEAQKGAFYQNIMEASSLLAELYDQKNYQMAFQYSKTAAAAKDSLISIGKRNAYKNLTDFDEKERQYEIETATASYQNKVKLYSLLAGLGVFLVIAFILYRNSRKQKEANAILQKQKQEIETQKKNVEGTLEQLKSTQAQLIQSEKMASLGELTAGIAHEIQNPLNFVNNFSEVNKEMLEELKAERLKQKAERDEQTEAQIIEDVIANEEKINHHGKRADAIVKGMLQHSRSSSGVKEPTDINALADEYLRLAYHGLRAKDKSFNATMKTDFDNTIGKINIVPQDIGRVLLNLFNNAFYAVSEKQKSGDENYKPLVTVATKSPSLLETPARLSYSGGGWVEVIVSDNGNGIPQKIVDKIFQPFFTTKPTGQGTGLGLSLSYDIIKAHGGEIKVETKEGEGSEFVFNLPII